MRKPALLMLALLVCERTSSSKGIEPGQPGELRRGQTNYDEVVRHFGRPDFTSTSRDGTRTSVYIHSAGKADAQGTGLASGGTVLT